MGRALIQQKYYRSYANFRVTAASSKTSAEFLQQLKTFFYYVPATPLYIYFMHEKDTAELDYLELWNPPPS